MALTSAGRHGTCSNGALNLGLHFLFAFFSDFAFVLLLSDLNSNAKVSWPWLKQTTMTVKSPWNALFNLLFCLASHKVSIVCPPPLPPAPTQCCLDIKFSVVRRKRGLPYYRELTMHFNNAILQNSR